MTVAWMPANFRVKPGWVKENDMVPDNKDDSMEFGLWPTIVGFTLATVIFLTMFALATGFS